MKSDRPALDPNPPRPNRGAGFGGRILRLVKGGPERRAMEAGEVDAVMDPATGTALLLPDAQQAVRQDQARIRSLLALSADWLWEQDERYRFVSHTGAASGSSGIFDENIIGKTLRDPPFGNMSEADWRAHQRLLKWRATFRDLELRCTDRSGGMRWVSISGEATFDVQDRFTGYRGTMRDITLRKRSEAPAQISRENIVEREEQPPGLEHKVAKGDSVANSLLAALPPRDYQRVLAGLEPVTLTYGEVLYECGEPIQHVYFPSDCLVSLLTTVEGHRALEVGLVGREGMVGISLALGIDVSSVRALVQGSGTAVRMSAACFREELGESRALREELYRYTHTKLTQVRQTAVCNQFHGVKARLARWLLMTHDRVRSDEFLLTQAFLADMLGVRRVGVSAAAAALQQLRLIGYSRGRIRILDRKGLEAAACVCYEILKDMRDGTQAA
jgi:PAS domain S-box-containing protein